MAFTMRGGAKGGGVGSGGGGAYESVPTANTKKPAAAVNTKKTAAAVKKTAESSSEDDAHKSAAAPKPAQAPTYFVFHFRFATFSPKSRWMFGLEKRLFDVKFAASWPLHRQRPRRRSLRLEHRQR